MKPGKPQPSRQINTRSFRNTDSGGNSASSSPSLVESPTKEGAHPLHNSWTLWYYSHNPDRNWEENLLEVVTFNTVEDFWGVYNHILVASELRDKCDYALFKKGIKPMWEDPSNVDGGRWICSFETSKRHSDKNTVGLDNYWTEILMCLIGEAFGEEYGSVVNGAVVAVRPRMDKIGIWLNDSNNEKAIMAAGRLIKQRLNYDRQIVFEAHVDNQKKSGSTAKRRHYL